MTKTERHELAILKLQIRAMEKSAIVSRPMIEGTRYDLVVDWCHRLYRVQIKYADSVREDALMVNFRSCANGKISSPHYTVEEIDAVAVYSPKIEKILWINADIIDRKSTMSFRTQPSKNCQVKGCHILADYIW